MNLVWRWAFESKIAGIGDLWHAPMLSLPLTSHASRFSSRVAPKHNFRVGGEPCLQLFRAKSFQACPTLRMHSASGLLSGTGLHTSLTATATESAPAAGQAQIALFAYEQTTVQNGEMPRSLLAMIIILANPFERILTSANRIKTSKGLRLASWSFCWKQYPSSCSLPWILASRKLLIL